MEIPKRDTMKFLKFATRSKAFLPIRDRLRAILLARRGKTIAQIAAQLEYSDRWVQLQAARYRQGGVNALWDKPRSGAPRKLPPDRENDFVERVTRGPTEADQISVFNARHLRDILEEEFGAVYTQAGVYTLLERLQLSWITSRQRHEFNDPARMEEWKERFRAKVREVKKKLPESRSRCGFKMKPALGNMAISTGSGRRRGPGPGLSNSRGILSRTFWGPSTPGRENT